MARPSFNPDHVTMMDYRTGEIPYNQSEQIEQDIMYGSSFMRLAQQVQMTKPIEKFTHMSGVDAYWVDEAESKPTSAPDWSHYEMQAKKLAVIIPVTMETLRYSVTNFFELMRPAIAEAFYKKLDAAAFAGLDNPFKYSIIDSVNHTGQIIVETDNKYDDINNAMAMIEAYDYTPRGVASTNRQKVLYRATKDDNGLPIFNPGTWGQGGEPDRVVGLPISWMHNAAFGDGEIAEIIGDWNYAKYGILSGIEYDISTEATIPTLGVDDNVLPVSLWQRNMAAIRAEMMVGIMITKDEAFSVVKKGTGGGSGGGDDA